MYYILNTYIIFYFGDHLSQWDRMYLYIYLRETVVGLIPVLRNNYILIISYPLPKTIFFILECPATVCSLPTLLHAGINVKLKNLCFLTISFMLHTAPSSEEYIEDLIAFVSHLGIKHRSHNSKYI